MCVFEYPCLPILIFLLRFLLRVGPLINTFLLLLLLLSFLFVFSMDYPPPLLFFFFKYSPPSAELIARKGAVYFVSFRILEAAAEVVDSPKLSFLTIGCARQAAVLQIAAKPVFSTFVFSSFSFACFTCRAFVF